MDLKDNEPEFKEEIINRAEKTLRKIKNGREKSASLEDVIKEHGFKEKFGNVPNKETIEAIKEADRNIENLKSYSSADKLFDDFGIDY